MVPAWRSSRPERGRAKGRGAVRALSASPPSSSRPSRMTTRPWMIDKSARAGAQNTSAASGSCSAPAKPTSFRSNATTSAAMPGARWPMSSRPSTRAPPRVASVSASRAVNAAGPAATRCSSSAWRVSASRCDESLDAAPSTPSPTATPASSIARTGAMPDASRMFDDGQCATPVPLRAKSSMPRASSLTQCACQACGPVKPSSSAVFGRRAAEMLARVRDVVVVLGEMRVQTARRRRARAPPFRSSGRATPRTASTAPRQRAASRSGRAS